ncbi:RNA-directed DNA polymerase, eukaryota, reverse transcriptase zinc-binding domain protein [Tanacetum coccineum]
MSTIRQNDKRQIRVPSKLIDFDYGIKVNKTKKKSKNRVLNNEIGDSEEYVKVQEGNSGIEADLQEKSYEVEEDSGNRGAKVVETVIDKDEDELVSLDSGSKSNVSENMDKPVISSYAKILNQKLDNKLTRIPTVISDNGVEVVIFDDEIIKEGSKKWDLTVCGYFVGYKMSYQELRYNIFRMWGKYGLKNIITHGNGMYLFKFKNENGLSDVIENGPWMVNEAWSTKGISAIASRLGNPLIMDQVTTQMCNSGNRRTGYARVMIKVEADIEVPDQVEIVYKNGDNMEIRRKIMKVEYDWKPPLCSFCLLFGHTDEKCRYRPRTVEEIEENDKAVRDVEER